MDPNATLAEIRQLAYGLADIDPDTETVVNMRALLSDASILAQHIQDLDGWIRKGGFLPSSWRLS